MVALCGELDIAGKDKPLARYDSVCEIENTKKLINSWLEKFSFIMIRRVMMRVISEAELV